MVSIQIVFTDTMKTGFTLFVYQNFQHFFD